MEKKAAFAAKSSTAGETPKLAEILAKEIIKAI